SEKGEFYLLQLQGELEVNFSKKTGLPYATMRKCTIPSTFDERICKTLIGKQIRGMIEKVKSEPYDYTIPETGEVISIDYQYSYVPEEVHQMEKAVFETGEPQMV